MTPSSGRRGRPVQLPLVLAGLAALLVVAALVAIPLLGDDDSDESSRDQAATAEPDLDAVEVYQEQPSHTQSEVDYQQSPPVGGAHDPRWLDCGVYASPVREENVVHDLEHGTVWITYRLDLDASDVDTLEDALPENGILSPYDDLPAPVVVTVWNHQLLLEGAEDQRLALFVDAYGDGVTAPEPEASCAGGVQATGIRVTIVD